MDRVSLDNQSIWNSLRQYCSVGDLPSLNMVLSMGEINNTHMYIPSHNLIPSQSGNRDDQITIEGTKTGQLVDRMVEDVDDVGSMDGVKQEDFYTEKGIDDTMGVGVVSQTRDKSPSYISNSINETSLDEVHGTYSNMERVEDSIPFNEIDTIQSKGDQSENDYDSTQFMTHSMSTSETYM